MHRERLKQTLRQLHDELSTQAALEPDVRKLLTELAQEIDAALENPPEQGESGRSHEDEEESLLDRVTGMGRQFEESNPRLARIIGRIADALSQLGI